MISRRRWLGGIAALAGGALLAACQGVDIRIQTAAQATPEQARELVGLIYAQAPDSAIAGLPYAYGDFTRYGIRLKGRLPELRPWFDQGVLGNTAGGFVAVRLPERLAEVRALVRAENADRAILYGAAADVVGHGSDDLQAWLPYERESFGKAWIEQAPAGWWYRDEQGAWQQRP